MLMLPVDICIVAIIGHTDGLQTFTAHNALYTSVEAEHSMSHYEMSEV